MKRKFFCAFCWSAIAILMVGIITDWIVLLGYSRAVQYIFNFFAFCVIVGLLYLAIGDKLYQR